MQGIIITGFAFWTVNRESDGPFKCYKYMQGANANESVQALSESCLRNIIANSTLEDVMRNRDHVRSSMLKDLKNQLTGWGMWI
jgi:regulator of protease activity HflC (stomatin/prohibitin superfamily)